MLANALLFATTTAAEPSGASLVVSWDDNSAIESGFKVRRRLTTVGGSYTLAATTAANVETVTLTGLAYGTSYDITVASYNGSGEYAVLGPYSRYTDPEFAPTSLTAGTITSSTVAVNFTAAAGVTKYQGYYRESGDTEWLTGPAITSGTSINFTGLTASLGYQFMIRGYFTNPDIEEIEQTSSYSPDSVLVAATTAAIPTGWETKQLIASIGDSIVSTEGTLVEAINLGDGSYSTKTINTVPFLGVTTRNDLSSFFGTSGFYQGGNVGSDFEFVLDSVCYGGSGNINFAGLTIGAYYMVQAFMSDERDSGTIAAAGTYAIEGFTSPSITRGPGYAVMCRFIASSTTVVFTTNGQLNAFQLRLITPP